MLTFPEDECQGWPVPNHKLFLGEFTEDIDHDNFSNRCCCPSYYWFFFQYCPYHMLTTLYAVLRTLCVNVLEILIDNFKFNIKKQITIYAVVSSGLTMLNPISFGMLSKVEPQL